MNLLHELPPSMPERYIETPKETLLDVYAAVLAERRYPGYQSQQNRLFLDDLPYDAQGHFVFDNLGPWLAGKACPTNEEKHSEVLHNIGYPKMCTLDADYRPLHPWWKEMVQRPDIGGVIGKGFFYRWGANYTADAAVTAHDETGTPHLLLIQRGDTGEWALPGGFLEESESTKHAAVRELYEESGLLLSREDAQADKIYAGPVLDVRTTIHAWIETSLWLFETRCNGLPAVRGNDDAIHAQWFRLDAIPTELYGSHAVLIDMVLRRLASGTADHQVAEPLPL